MPTAIFYRETEIEGEAVGVIVGSTWCVDEDGAVLQSNPGSTGKVIVELCPEGNLTTDWRVDLVTLVLVPVEAP